MQITTRNGARKRGEKLPEILRRLTPLICSCTNPVPDVWSRLGGAFVLLLIGGGHFAIGTALLWRNRISLDRNAGIIVTRSGWLGVVWHRFPLAQFRSLSVRTAVARWFYLVHDGVREIVLTGDACRPLVVGFATSEELATEIESEVCSFLGLTEIESRRTMG